MSDNKIWSRPDLERLGIREDDVGFLSKQGLEVGSFYFIDVYPGFEFNRGIVLGYDHDVPIVCSEDAKGIFAFEETVERFVNASAEQFAQTIKRLGTYREQVVDNDDEDAALRIVNSAINDLKAIDRVAWSDPNNYWPIVGQQMIEGNL